MIDMRLIFKELKKIKKDNKGSALIVSIIVLLFVSILATVILYMAGVNYRMKKAELNTTISFYSGEETLERFQSNLIVPVSESLNNAYGRANAHYADLGSDDERRRLFYSEFAIDFKKLLIEKYGGTNIGGSGALDTHTTFIKNMFHNLTYYDNAACDTGIPVADVFLTDGSIAGSDGYVNDPIGFVDFLASGGYLPGDPTGAGKVYVCIADGFSEPGNADDNFDKFCRLEVTDDPDTEADPVHPTGTLVDPKECRMVFKNIAIVYVQNDYRSIITTDLAIQFPPLDWGGGSSTDGYCNWNAYQLMYYVNWKRN